MFDALIIGAGCAGLSCALWLHNLHRRVLLLEQTAVLGGIAARNTFPITNVLGQTNQGAHLRTTYQQQLSQAQLPILYHCHLSAIETQTDHWRLQVDDLHQHYTLHGRSLVLATGSRPRPCPLPTPNERWIHDPLDPRLRQCFGQTIAIFGGGDNALENALALRRQDNHVSVYTRGQFRARHDFLSQAQAHGIALYTEAPLTELAQSSPFHIRFTAGTQHGQANWGMSFFGFMGNTEDFNALSPTPLHTSAEGFVYTDAYGRTNISGVFAIGDVVVQPYPCIPTALAHGATVAKVIAEERFVV